MNATAPVSRARYSAFTKPEITHAFANLVPMEKDEWVNTILTVREFAEDKSFLFASRRGMVKRSSAALQRTLLEVEQKRSQQEMDSLRQSEMQTAVYQHDMRHHLNMSSGLLASGSPQQAQEYIQKVQSDVESITSRRFCENETV